MWYYIVGGLKIKVILHSECNFGTKSSGVIMKGGLKIKACKIEGLLYNCMYRGPPLEGLTLSKEDTPLQRTHCGQLSTVDCCDVPSYMSQVKTELFGTRFAC